MYNGIYTNVPTANCIILNGVDNDSNNFIDTNECDFKTEHIFFTKDANYVNLNSSIEIWSQAASGVRALLSQTGLAFNLQYSLTEYYFK